MPLPSTWSRSGEYFIPYRLLLLARMIERDTTRDMQVACNISTAEWQVLALSCSYDNTSAADVSAAFGTDSAQVSRTVARLIKAGMVERDFDKNNRKQKVISATPQGRALFEKARAIRQDYYSWILQDLSEDERQNFDRMVKLIAARVDAKR